MTAGGVWTYTLNNANATVQALNINQTLVDTFTVTTADGTQQVVRVAINGTNDVAVISGTTSGSVIEAGGLNNATAGTATSTGTLTDTDIDNTANTFTAVASAIASTSGYGNYTITSGGVWTYNLNNANATVQALNINQTLVDTFTVTTVDGSQKVVSVTINGTNDTQENTATTADISEVVGVSPNWIFLPKGNLANGSTSTISFYGPDVIYSYKDIGSTSFKSLHDYQAKVLIVASNN